jgi:hypothetical protein
MISGLWCEILLLSFATLEAQRPIPPRRLPKAGPRDLRFALDLAPAPSEA